MTSASPAAAMARTLVDHGVDLTDDRAIIMRLVNAGYDARLIGESIDLAIVLARRIRDANEVQNLDDKLRVVSRAMGGG